MSGAKRYVIVSGTFVDDEGKVKSAGDSIELEDDCVARFAGQVEPEAVTSGDEPA